MTIDTLSRVEYTNKQSQGYAGPVTTLAPELRAALAPAQHWHMHWSSSGTTLSPVNISG